MNPCTIPDHTGLASQLHSCAKCKQPIEPLVCYMLEGSCDACTVAGDGWPTLSHKLFLEQRARDKAHEKPGPVPSTAVQDCIADYLETKEVNELYGQNHKDDPDYTDDEERDGIVDILDHARDEYESRQKE